MYDSQLSEASDERSWPARGVLFALLVAFGVAAVAVLLITKPSLRGAGPAFSLPSSGASKSPTASSALAAATETQTAATATSEAASSTSTAVPAGAVLAAASTPTSGGATDAAQGNPDIVRGSSGAGNAGASAPGSVTNSGGPGAVPPPPGGSGGDTSNSGAAGTAPPPPTAAPPPPPPEPTAAPAALLVQETIIVQYALLEQRAFEPLYATFAPSAQAACPYDRFLDAYTRAANRLGAYQLTGMSVQVQGDTAYAAYSVMSGGLVLFVATPANPDVFVRIDGKWYDASKAC